MTCSQWVKQKPTAEGWYLWRRTQSVTDPWKWNAYYVMPNEGRVTDHKGHDVPWSYWEAGTEVNHPRGGWWCRIDTANPGRQPRRDSGVGLNGVVGRPDDLTKNGQ